jgi:hypothetical protein
LSGLEFPRFPTICLFMEISAPNFFGVKSCPSSDEISAD